MASRFGFCVRHFSSSAVRQSGLVKAPTDVTGIEGRYAHALYSAAVKEKQVDAVSKDFQWLQTLLAENASVAQYLRDPVLGKNEKMATITDLMKAQKASDLTTNTLNALAENNRLNILNGVIKSFEKMVGTEKGVLLCTVKTAKPLSKKQLKEVTSVLEGFAKKGQEVQITTEVDSSIIGGMMVSIGDRFVDMSISRKMKVYSQLVKEAI